MINDISVECWDISTALSNGVITFDKEDRSEGTVATATCSSGYSLVGESSLTCSGGKWSNDIPKCVATCDVFTIENGAITGAQQPAFAGDVITITCNTGYVINGETDLTCDGCSFGSTPSCDIQQCDTLSIPDGTISPVLPVDHGTQVVVNCDSGYKIPENKSPNVVCDAVSNSFGEVPECGIKVKCPNFSFKGFRYGSSRDARYNAVSGDIIEIAGCKRGFKWSGTNKVTCGDDGQWQDGGDPPMCKKNENNRRKKITSV